MEEEDLKEYNRISNEGYKLEDHFKKLKAEMDLLLINIKKKYNISSDQGIKIDGGKLYVIKNNTIDEIKTKLKGDTNETHDPSDI